MVVFRIISCYFGAMTAVRENMKGRKDIPRYYGIVWKHLHRIIELPRAPKVFHCLTIFEQYHSLLEAMLAQFKSFCSFLQYSHLSEGYESVLCKQAKLQWSSERTSPHRRNVTSSKLLSVILSGKNVLRQLFMTYEPHEDINKNQVH